MALNFFLTAYDPSDLPGGSMDPLGFERGYLHLADKILPGMTNVANCPRYFGMLCAGASLVKTDHSLTLREQGQKRKETILRFERLWALANVLAAADRSNGALSGLRGVTYAERQVEVLENRGWNKTDCNFKLLSRQMPYGALGMYGAVAENCKLIYRRSYELTPGLGQPLAEAFIKETDLPKIVERAAVEDGEVPLSVLADWGTKAYLWGMVGPSESRHLRDMLHMDSVRSRFVQILMKDKPRENETELERLGRIASRLKDDAGSLDLWEAVASILGYEKCYRLALLAFERLLYLCRYRSDPSGAFNLRDLESDAVMQQVRTNLPPAVNNLTGLLDGSQSEHFRFNLNRLEDVRGFLESVAQNCEIGTQLADCLLIRHTDIQHGKFDRGKRKMPWLQSADGKLSLTVTRAGGLGNKEAKNEDDIAAHPYRLSAADNWLKAAKEI